MIPIGKILRRLRYELIDAPQGRGRSWTPEVWNGQFESGAWDHLYSVEELGHYMVILGYLLHFGAKEASVLDVGCGHGRLLEILQRSGFREYLGTDISASATEKAASLQIANTSFEVCSFDEWRSNRLFDCIIFNESLCYATDPKRVLANYQHNLTAGGKFIVSLHHFGNHRQIWKTIDQDYQTLATDTIENGREQRWTVKVMDPRNPILLNRD